jgi:hypothetical protein
MSGVPLETDISLPFPIEFVIRDTPRSHQSPNTKGKELWKRKVGEIASAHVKTLKDFFFLAIGRWRQRSSTFLQLRWTEMWTTSSS